MDVGTVKSRLHRARERLRRTLAPFLAGAAGAAGRREKGRRDHDARRTATPSGTRSSHRLLAAVERPGGAGRAWTSGCSPRTAARRARREPWWSRLFTASVRVPLPVAVGLLMLLIVTAALALRPVAPPPTAGTTGPSEPVQAARRGDVAGGVADEPRRLPAGDRGDGHGGDRPDGDAAMKSAAAAALCWRRASPPPPRADERVAFATLENGASIGFALVRTGAQGPGGGDRRGRAAALELGEPRAVGPRERRLLRLPGGGGAARTARGRSGSRSSRSTGRRSSAS